MDQFDRLNFKCTIQAVVMYNKHAPNKTSRIHILYTSRRDACLPRPVGIIAVKRQRQYIVPYQTKAHRQKGAESLEFYQRILALQTDRQTDRQIGYRSKTQTQTWTQSQETECNDESEDDDDDDDDDAFDAKVSVTKTQQWYLIVS